MRLNMANAFFVRYRGREALQRGLKRYEYLFAIMSAFEEWRAVKRCCVVEVKVQFLVLRQSAESARDILVLYDEYMYVYEYEYEYVMYVRVRTTTCM